MFGFLLCFVLCFSFVSSSTYPDYNSVEDYQDVADLIIQTALDQTNLTRINFLCDAFGHRYAGSQHLKDATAWIIQTMKDEKLNGTTEEVPMTQWFRGNEYAAMVSPYKREFSILGLGGTIPSNGLVSGRVLVVHNFTELSDRAEEAKGKIVVYNVPFTSYQETVAYRKDGAIEASKVGGIAALVRSAGPESLYTPHAGSSYYEDGVKPIPTFSLTLEDSELIERLQTYGFDVVLEFNIDSYWQDIVGSNILATIPGREKPNEFTAFGGHIDSWDVGSGANDDGAGYFATWEAMRLLNKLISQKLLPVPRRSMRSIGWFNEERGADGAYKYYNNHRKSENHIFIGECDAGTFKPIELGFSGGTQEGFAVFEQVVGLLSEFDIVATYGTGEKTDTKMWCTDGTTDTPCVSLLSEGHTPDNSTYYNYHHTNADTPDKLSPDGIRQSVASIAVVMYVIADLPDGLSFWEGKFKQQ